MRVSMGWAAAAVISGSLMVSAGCKEERGAQESVIPQLTGDTSSTGLYEDEGPGMGGSGKAGKLPLKSDAGSDAGSLGGTGLTLDAGARLDGGS